MNFKDQNLMLTYYFGNEISYKNYLKHVAG